MSYFLLKYKYCPLCSGKLQKQKEFISCQSCGYKLFHNSIPSVNVMIESEKGELLMVTRKINPFRGWLDFPGGFMKAGETLEQCGAREAKEELGIDVEIKEYVGSYQLNYEYLGLIYKLVTAFFKAIPRTRKIKVSDDVSSFKYMTREAILKSKRVCYPRVNKSAVRDYFEKNL